MDFLHVSKPDLLNFIGTLIAQKDRQVIGVVAKGRRYAFDVLDKADDLRFDFDETILPPKKYLLPPVEKLLTFSKGDPASYEAIVESVPRIIIGMHPADMAAVALLDKALTEGNTDHHYLSRRKAAILVGIYPTRPYEYRFSSSMVNGEANQAADAMLVDMGDGTFGVEAISIKGRDLFARSGARPADRAFIDRMDARKELITDQVKVSIPRDALPGFLAGKENHRVFARRGELCLSCGSCVMVCPTCYCFDVTDEMELSLAQGERIRKWDSCMLNDFALVAGGHNFRKKRVERLRHRMFRKGKYLKERFGLMGCVGCGRCANACVADIASPAEIVNEMNEKGA